MKLILASKPSTKEDGWFGFQDILISLVLGKQNYTISRTVIYICLGILLCFKSKNWLELKSLV